MWKLGCLLLVLSTLVGVGEAFLADESSTPLLTQLTSSLPESSTPLLTQLTSSHPESSTSLLPQLTSSLPESSTSLLPQLTSSLPESSTPLLTQLTSSLQESSTPLLTQLTSTHPESSTSLLPQLTSSLPESSTLSPTGTCQGRCGYDLDPSKSCQCNSACTRFNDCCRDYNNLCAGSTTSCATLAQISQELWNADVNRLSTSDVTLNYQSKVPDNTKTDHSQQRFFTTVNEGKLSGQTYRTFLALLDNYDPAKGAKETLTSQEQTENNAFLTAVLATNVMNTLLKFLTCRGVVSNQNELRSTLTKLWFDFYPRSGTSTTPDTSGFEHVLVGEYKSATEVNGFHNWLSFYEKEKAGQINYFGYVTRNEPSLVGASFSWNSRFKTLGSFFIGVSPEFDMAIYTLCYYMHRNANCPVVLNGHTVTIRTYDVNGHLSTAYPGVSD